jgi:hypothetical protein
VEFREYLLPFRSESFISSSPDVKLREIRNAYNILVRKPDINIDGRIILKFIIM